MVDAKKVMGSVIGAATGRDGDALFEKGQKLVGPEGLKGTFDKASALKRKALDGDAEFVVKGQKPDEYYRLEQARDGTFKALPYRQGEITPDEVARAKTLPQMQQDLKTANTPAAISQSLSRAQKIDSILSEKTGRTRDTDLDDNISTLSKTSETIPGKGKVKAKTVAIDHTTNVVETRRELIGEFEQRLDELSKLKKKDHPELFEKEAGSNITVKDNLEKAIKDEIKTLKEGDALPSAIDAYQTMMNAPAAAPVAKPAAAPKAPNPLD